MIAKSTIISVFNEHEEVSKSDIDSIMHDVIEAMDSETDNDPLARNSLLKFQSIWRLIKRSEGKIEYQNFRKASDVECERSGIPTEFINMKEVSAFHFIETLGLRATFMLNLSKRTGTLIAIRHVDLNARRADGCLDFAARRMNLLKD